MSRNSVKDRRASADTDPNCRALTHLFDEYQRAKLERNAADTRLARFAETIQFLLDGLPAGAKEDYARRFEDIKQDAALPSRGGEVYGSVVALFQNENRRKWSVSEVQEALAKQGDAPDSKAIHNVIGYLARTGRLKRVARGQYVVTHLGVGIEAEKFDDGTSRVTEHDV